MTKQSKSILFILFLFWDHIYLLKDYSWLCPQGQLLAVLGGLWGARDYYLGGPHARPWQPLRPI